MGLSLLSTTDTQIIRVVEALYNQTPGYTFLSNYRTFVTENSIEGFANSLAVNFASSTDAELAAVVTSNLGLTGDALTGGNAYLEGQFAAAPAARGEAILAAMNLLATMESDATFGAIATSFNADVLASTSYSIVTTNTAALVAGAGQTFALTTSSDNLIGTNGADTFNSGAPTAATQALSNSDSIDGGTGADVLNATVANASTYSLSGLSNVETLSANFTATGTLSMLGASGVTAITNNASTAAGIFTAIDSATTALTVSNTTSNTTFDVANTALAGASDNASLALIGVTATVNVAPVSGTEGFETITISTSGSASTVTLNDDTATDLTSLVITGDQDLALTTTPTTITSIDASGLTGVLTHTVTNAAAVTVTGGAGNDAITAEATASNDNISAGAGDDTVTFTATLANTDTVNGGDGTDILASTSALLAGYTTPSTLTISNFETLSVTDALGSSLTAATVQAGITTVNLAAGSGAFTVTLEAGDKVVNVAAANTGTVVINDTGTATTDTLRIDNTATTATDVLAGEAITVGGFETVTIDSGDFATITGNVDIGALSVTADSGGTSTVNFVGSATVDVAAITAGTIDASGLTGTALLSQSAAAVATTGGSITITGSANADVLVGDANDSSVISGGAGNDTITGSSDHDTLNGGDGVDTITSAAGNDVIDAGAGNDTITLAGNLATGDVIDGGDGTDTLSITTAGQTTLNGYAISTISNLNGNLSNIERVTISDSVNVGSNFDMARLDNISYITIADGITGNEGFSGLQNNATVVATADNNADTDILTLALGDSAGTADVLNYTATQGATDDYGVIAVSGVETLNITVNEATASATVRVATLGTNITVSTNGTTVNFLGTETITVDTAIAAQTINSTTTGAFIMTNTTGSALSQTITSGAGADSIYGGGGADTISSGAGADSIIGGAGVDSITAGTGADTILGGAGNDTITLTESAPSVDDVVLDWTEGGADIDVIVGFTTTATGDEIQLDLTALEAVTAAGGLNASATDFVELNDGNSVSAAAAGVQVLTAAATVADAKNVLVLQGAVFSSEAEVEDALEASGSYALTISATDNQLAVLDAFAVVYTDGTDAHVATVRIVTDPGTTGAFSAGELDVQDLATITGVTTIGASTFAAGNFEWI